jgi:hypothetical protein
MSFERYNKAWAAAIPLVVFLINTYTDHSVTAEQVIDWTDAAMMALGPIFVWWIPNRDPEPGA